MPPNKPLNRREALRNTAVLAGGVVAFSGCGPSVESPWRFFTPEEAKLADLVCERIIPTDQDPGASEAGVVHFLDRLLIGDYHRYRETYRQGLAALETVCQATQGKPFAELSAEEQETFLKVIEGGKFDRKALGKANPQKLFKLMVKHTMQGFYGHPKHGGNRNAVAYKMLGYEYPRINGQNRYTQPKETPPQPKESDHVS